MSGPAALSNPQDAIAGCAAAFWERRRFGEWSEADQAELDAWLAESTFHRVAFLRVEAIAARTDALASVHDFRNAAKANGPARAESAAFRFRWFAIPLLAAASVALFAALGFPFVKSLMQPPDRMDSTEVGGRTLLSFSDRTQIELNTASAVRLRMTTAERTVWLEKGEAWFHVAHDAAHPFTVIAGRHRITDLGTEFLVRRDGDDVDVTLLNGRAVFSAEGAQTAILNPGEEAVATLASLTVTRKTPQQLADELAWRRGMLVFRNAPLSQVVREFNRYNATRLVIADPSIADERIYADLKTDDYGSFLQMAEDVLKLRVDRHGNSILLSRAPAKAKRTKAASAR